MNNAIETITGGRFGVETEVVEPGKGMIFTRKDLAANLVGRPRVEWRIVRRASGEE